MFFQNLGLKKWVFIFRAFHLFFQQLEWRSYMMRKMKNKRTETIWRLSSAKGVQDLAFVFLHSSEDIGLVNHFSCLTTPPVKDGNRPLAEAALQVIIDAMRLLKNGAVITLRRPAEAALVLAWRINRSGMFTLVVTDCKSLFIFHVWDYFHTKIEDCTKLFSMKLR